MAQHRVIYKSTSVEFLDDFYRRDVEGSVGFAQDLLSDPDAGAMGIAESWASNAGFDGGELQGFQTRWLDEDSALSAHDVDRVLRAGHREAVTLAAAHDPVVPVETFWVRGAGDDFEVHIHDGVDRVTVFMFLPVVRRYGSWEAGTRSYVVRVGDLDDVHPGLPRIPVAGEGKDAVLRIQVSGQPDPPLEPLD